LSFGSSVHGVGGGDHFARRILLHI
jgi:hypothetical protein